MCFSYRKTPFSVASPSIYGFTSFIFFHVLQPRFRSFVSCVVHPPFLGSFVVCFASFSWAMRLPFSFSSCSSGVFVFLPQWFLVSVLGFDPYFLVRSLRPRLLSFFGSVFLFCTFETLQFFCPASFFVTVQPFPVLVFHTSSSASSWVLCCLCFSTVRSISTPPPGFPLVVMGIGLCSLACCGSYVSGCYSAFVSSLRLRYPLLLRSPATALIILSPFPHTAFQVAPSSLPLHFSVG